jgi:uridine monophosphate synthetase
MIPTLAERLHALGAVQFGEFTLKDGSRSPVYVDLRLLVSNPGTLAYAAQGYARLLTGLSFQRIAAIPYAGLPLGTAVALATGRPMIYPRREVKGYGTGRTIEGIFESGETVVVLDDVIASGASKREAIEPLEAAGLVVKDVVVLVDRQGSGAADLAAAGYRLHAVTTLGAIAAELAELGRISPAQAGSVLDYLAAGKAQSAAAPASTS